MIINKFLTYYLHVMRDIIHTTTFDISQYEMDRKPIDIETM